ncbi:LodA/GoxA family CTQ-dependent oxidase [uncultured Tateyamaria sp.]|uniref:LodA/GoxA family CTQ-dependent oxidase n=1 Tax=uncultured Tateyamaria sp. TaxID=455651 RepID=UPI0026200949|nr:LodA/GoxA family CTQ-dependent oxidase [uncultured Tateyamaria sp.]
MRLTSHSNDTSHPSVDCAADPVQSLVTMFVDMIQKGRIKAGQCPAMRPVFLKPHGVAHGTFRMRPDMPDDLKVGVFAGSEYPMWLRSSSDTLPTVADYKTTVGLGIKLFDTPTPKIFGAPDDTTFDFIFQNMDVFFVDTAQDMCAFTKAGVIDGDYGPYLAAHPRTKDILDAMQKPVGSVFGSPYWSILPFALGPDGYVKYKLEPVIDVDVPDTPLADPTYLAADFKKRLAGGAMRFRFLIQRRTNPDTMPLDAATVPWPEDQSPFVHVADIELPQQDVDSMGQAAYGENLAWNIWRVTEDHAPQGSIALARRDVYSASADTRRNANGIPDGEPLTNRPPYAVEKDHDMTPVPDTKIVRAAIHPAIGVARVGDAQSAFFVGPEVTHPPQEAGDYFRDGDALKRQAAKFRIYGYNAAGEAVRELDASNASITWTVELANRKAQWYQFITAMDIPETADLSVIRRNKDQTSQADREKLAITPGPRSISGMSVSGGAEHAFDTGSFTVGADQATNIYLGEVQTTETGQLLVLGGRGVSKSLVGAPPFDPADPDSFNNANTWYDDMADGPVTAEVSIDGTAIPVEGGWVTVAPPNYAPDVIGWRTMYDLMVDTFVGAGTMPVPAVTSFTKDVLPQLQRMSNLQWVNKGFATMFGKGGPMDFDDPTLISRLAQAPGADDPWHELRQQIMNAFRPTDTKVNEPRIWPWIYGDDFGGDLDGPSPRTMLALPSIQQLHLSRWVDGNFVADWDPNHQPPQHLSDIRVQDQPAMLDQAALHFCLADAFHPGCELTWPMRHASLYSSPFRIRHRPDDYEDYGKELSATVALSPTGPLHGQRAGDLTRWMGLPWQGDTAYCRAGYAPDYDPYLPTFWPGRVPNHVLTEEDYQIVIDPSKPLEDRVAAFNRRASWYRFIDEADGIAKRMERMIAIFGQQGIVEPREGVRDVPDFPDVLYVETVAPSLAASVDKAVLLAASPEAAQTARDATLSRAGWHTEAHLEEAVNLRRRR